MVSKTLIYLNLVLIDSMRNYAILHIVADEAKIFQTKERAPVLLHFEAFRPEELMLEVGPERTLSQAIDTSNKEKVKKGKQTNQPMNLERYDNYRSQSVDSASDLTEAQLEMLQGNRKTTKIENPY